VLLGSIAALREAGHEATYRASLPHEARETLTMLIAGTWIPLDVALAHYRACDALGLTSDAQVELGRSTLSRTKGSILGTALRLAQDAGVTPWSVLPHFQRFWLRGYDGGGIRVTRIGPKEAEIDVVECGLTESRYYRNALRGHTLGIVQALCQKAYLHERPGLHPHGAVTYRAQWV
jgi:hypothetical protein